MYIYLSGVNWPTHYALTPPMIIIIILHDVEKYWALSIEQA